MPLFGIATDPFQDILQNMTSGVQRAWQPSPVQSVDPSAVGYQRPAGQNNAGGGPGEPPSRGNIPPAQSASAMAAAAQAQAQARASEAPEPSPRPPVILVFKNGQQIESQGYAIMGDILWVLTESGNQRVALSSLDVAATQRENLKRGIEFPDVGS